MPKKFVWDVVSAAAGTTTALAVIAFIARSLLWHLLVRRVEHLKNDLAKDRQRDLEAFRKELDLDRSEKELVLRSKISFMERQLGELYWPIYSRLQKDNAIWDFMQRYRDTDNYDRDLIRAIEMDTLLPNHKEIVNILESHLHLAQADADLMELSQKYIRHVAVFQAMRTQKWRADPKDLGEPWPYEFFDRIKTETEARQKEYEALLEEERSLRRTTAS